ncbi:site-specific integrase [Vibrio cyclitrophicus]|uniref:site-specific integrase n=1 Tax=Vibrio cyclitrophicus TaxID=47951 RepID=UPI000C853C57|nr:site-specific integrase [Vibrio cyclitrophicus]PME78015.1 hypothetical protein BCV29_11025 [Vibrio cyclitrophicus]
MRNKYKKAKLRYRNYLNKKGTKENVIDSILNKIITVFRLTDKDPFKLSADEVINIYGRLYKMPRYMHQQKSLIGLTGEDIINKSKSLGLKIVSEATVEKYLGAVKSFFDWCVSLGLLNRNCFSKLKAKKNGVKDNEQRKAYSEEQLSKLLKASIPDWSKISDLGWILIIAIELGMRQNEIAQLHKLDVVEVDGINCIFITDRLPLQSVKNEYSVRYIPITKSMIRLGFLDFVESKPEMLFDSLTYCKKNNFSRKVSEHYSEVNRSLFDNERLTFYSIRHYFVDKLKQNDLPEDLVAEINGRKHDKETYGRYGKDRPLKYKKKVLNKYGSFSVAQYARTVAFKNRFKIFKNILGF